MRANFPGAQGTPVLFLVLFWSRQASDLAVLASPQSREVLSFGYAKTTNSVGQFMVDFASLVGSNTLKQESWIPSGCLFPTVLATLQGIDFVVPLPS